MKRSVITLLHFGFWTCYLMLVFVVMGALMADSSDVSETRIAYVLKIMFLFAVVPSAISFYTFYFVLFPFFLQKKRYVLFSMNAILVSFASALISYFLLSLFATNCGKDNNSLSTVVGVTLFVSFISLSSGIVSLVIRGFISWFEEIKLKEQLSQRNHEMELALVKSQLDPHFLFNTLNNIDVLILKNAHEASEYLNKLSDIMRFMLFETKTDKILLSKEMEYIEKYIELQKIRTSNSSYVQLSIDGSCGEKTIAPMVFIPFIENAFKHTINKKLANAIQICVLIKEDFIKLICENKYNPELKHQPGSNGLGNDLIEKRLNLIYPGKHLLEVFKEEDLYRVHLTIHHG